MLLYADDIVIISQTGVGLQSALQKMEEYCRKWKLKVNLKKTKIVIFRRGGSRNHKKIWFYNGQRIEVVDKYN